MTGGEELKAQLTALIARLEPGPRRRALAVVARELRRSNQRRIAAQVQPDGSDFAPRKPRTSDQRKGSVRRRARAMFGRLRLARHMKAGSTPSEAYVEFMGRAAAIARVHHEGLEDNVAPGGPRVRYEKRELLGVSAEDEARIMDLLIAHLAGAR